MIDPHHTLQYVLQYTERRLGGYCYWSPLSWYVPERSGAAVVAAINDCHGHRVST